MLNITSKLLCNLIFNKYVPEIDFNDLFINISRIDRSIQSTVFYLVKRDKRRLARIYIYIYVKYAILIWSVSNEGCSIDRSSRRGDESTTEIPAQTIMSVDGSLKPRLRLLKEPVYTGGLSLFFFVYITWAWRRKFIVCDLLREIT